MSIFFTKKVKKISPAASFSFLLIQFEICENPSKHGLNFDKNLINSTSNFIKKYVDLDWT